MQETRDPITLETNQEFFKTVMKEKETQDQSDHEREKALKRAVDDMHEKMDNRLRKLEESGQELVRRVPITERQYNRATMTKAQRKKQRKAQKMARRKNR